MYLCIYKDGIACKVLCADNEKSMFTLLHRGKTKCIQMSLWGFEYGLKGVGFKGEGVGSLRKHSKVSLGAYEAVSICLQSNQD